jgi:hypothetical protein
MSDKWLLLADIYFAVVVGNVCVGGGDGPYPISDACLLALSHMTIGKSYKSCVWKGGSGGDTFQAQVCRLDPDLSDIKKTHSACAGVFIYFYL